ITYLWRRSSSRLNFLSNLKTVWSNDIALLSICINNQRNKCRSVWIVLNGIDCSLHSCFGPFKVDDTILFFMTTTQIAHGHFSLTVSTSCLFYRSKQAFLRLISSNRVKSAYYSKSLTRSYRF